MARWARESSVEILGSNVLPPLGPDQRWNPSTPGSSLSLNGHFDHPTAIPRTRAIRLSCTIRNGPLLQFRPRNATLGGSWNA